MAIPFHRWGALSPKRDQATAKVTQLEAELGLKRNPPACRSRSWKPGRGSLQATTSRGAHTTVYAVHDLCNYMQPP